MDSVKIGETVITKFFRGKPEKVEVLDVLIFNDGLQILVSKDGFEVWIEDFTKIKTKRRRLC